MANPLYESLYGNVQQPMQGNIQNGTTIFDQMNQLRANPLQMIRQAGYNVPENLSGNPQAIVMHLIQTGQVSNPAMQRIGPMLNQLMGR